MVQEASTIIRPARYAKQACPACRFFDGKIGADGHCRRNPPTVTLIPVQNAVGQTVPQPYSQFVPVKADWWCGEFKAKFDVESNG